MARMLPPQVFEKTVSQAERRLFAKIKRDLDDGWTVLHSLGLTGHKLKPWSEIDFVLIGPPGVFCLEVKGGRIGREEGGWVFIDRRDNATKKNEGPFEQVGSAAAALREYLTRRLPRLRGALIRYGVVTPDVMWKFDGPDTPQSLVCDASDMQAPFSTYVRRIVQYWRKRLSDGQGEGGELKTEDCTAIAEILRGDFQLFPYLGAQLRSVDSDLLRLTEQQYRTMTGLSLNDRTVVRGGAGTGKTMLAIHEARREAANGRHVLLTCFNRRLAGFLSKALHDVEGIVVNHLHGTMADYIRRAGLESRLTKSDESSLFNVHYPALATAAVRRLGETGRFDVLVVDEGQDLLQDSHLDFLSNLLKGGLEQGRWRIFLDHKQNLFGAIEPNTLERIHSYTPAQFELKLNCRNTAPIAMATCLFGDIPLDDISDVEGPDVVIHWYTDPVLQADMLDAVLHQLSEEHVLLDHVAVLCRKKLANSSLPTVLPSGTYLWEAGRPIPNGRYVEFSTISSFKGLEKDVVIVADIDDLRGNDARMALYVGISRARGLLVPFVSESERHNYKSLSERLGWRIASQKNSHGT